MRNYQHWKLDTDQDNILWLTFDRADARVNSLNDEVLGELKEIVTEVATQHLRGMIIQSGKSSGFIAGADIQQFGKVKTVNDAVNVMRQGQKLFDQIEQLPFRTVALIKGFCMGGGTELALACHFRIACDDEKTRLSLPEVKLGIHPGWGGSVRLPKLIGVLKAMPLMLAGTALRAKAAYKIGMVDMVVPERHLKTAARDYVLNRHSRRRANFIERLPELGFLRPLVASKLRKELNKKINEHHYPAPFALVKNWLRDGAKSESAMISEANSAGTLLMTPTSRHLVRVFFLQEKMKGLSKGVEYAPKHVHVIGAGAMGGDIAAWCALQGFNVTLQDREAKFIAPAMNRAYQLYQKRFKDPRSIQIAMDRLMPDVRGLGIKKADLIIEAIFENLEAKQNLFKMLESEAKPSAILASNTSSIPLDEISTVMQAPERLVGIHFFNPVPMMPLVEIVKSKKTAPDTVKHALKFVTVIGKQPIVVASKPGFLVNRCLLPYMSEAMALLDEGVSGPAIDKAATDFGMPMGPIELGDKVGLDVCLSVVKNLTQAFGGSVPQSLVKYVDEKKLGVKTGSGFYTYKNGRPIKGSITTSAPKDAIPRMMGRLLNECVACLREGVIDDIDLLDAGIIFGTGFAPFRGGPLQYARDRGIAKIKAELQDLASKYGQRFAPDPYWDTLEANELSRSSL